MYRPTRFSGKRPKFFAMECREPFSQYLELLVAANSIYSYQDTYSRMMFRVSTDLTNPWYLTMFACCDPLGQRFLNRTSLHGHPSYIQVLQQINLQL